MRYRFRNNCRRIFVDEIFFVFEQIDVTLSKMFIFDFLKKTFIIISMKEIQLFNEMIIYNFDKKAIDFFQQIINDYSIFFEKTSTLLSYQKLIE